MPISLTTVLFIQRSLTSLTRFRDKTSPFLPSLSLFMLSPFVPLVKIKPEHLEWIKLPNKLPKPWRL